MHLLILSLVSVLAVSGAKNVAKGNVACNEIRTCSAAMRTYRIGGLPILNAFIPNARDTEVGCTIFDEAFYTQFCQANAVFQSCFTDNKDACADPNMVSVSFMAEISAHLCSAQGREDIQSIAHSSCVTDQGAQQTSERAVNECLQTFYSQRAISAYVSPLVGKLKTCIQTTLTDRCGEDFSTYAMNLLDIWLSSSHAELNCN